MNRILRCDWRPLGIRALYTGHALVLFSHIINPLLTKLARSRWLDIGQVLFLRVTSPLVNNPYFATVNDSKTDVSSFSASSEVLQHKAMKGSKQEELKNKSFKMTRRTLAICYIDALIPNIKIQIPLTLVPKRLHREDLQGGHVNTRRILGNFTRNLLGSRIRSLTSYAFLNGPSLTTELLFNPFASGHSGDQ